MKDLQPTSVWAYFEEILEIPRLSKNEEKIIDYLDQFAKKNNLVFKKDTVGNCLITKPATTGFEDRQTVILQSHIDMVGEKLLEVEHDFSIDPIVAFEKDGWITAEGTTLGADDGIGVAASLAILTSADISHGPLECLFTVDEETGMTGAFGIEQGFLQGKILLNLDSEDEGELFIGCAGGIDTIGRFKKKTKEVPEKSLAFGFTVEGLQGGHSGDEIHKGFGNSIKLMNLVLWRLDKKIKMNIASFEGGKLRNAIPREASATIVLSEFSSGDFKIIFEEINREISIELKDIEPGFKLSYEEVAVPDVCFKRSFQRRLMNMIYACTHGVVAWCQDIDGLVETSTNLAVVRDDGDYIEVVTSQRSSNEFSKIEISDRIEALFLLAKGEVRHSDGYPGWNPNINSAILKVAEERYKELFNTAPEVKAIHAGLECGLFLEKYPDLDMISFGPTIKGAHTPEERIEIQSVSKFWDFLVDLLKNTPIR
ncbi:MAG: aminoacyl-histidine dipeptidase [Bacteroidales bacterium]|jgi:dipeptidase D|nr:aminoacyl-histidine dipeptidase [Bacteroidales bacterium]